MPENEEAAKLGLSDSAPESTPEVKQDQTPEAAEASSAEPKEKEGNEPTPFHEHPRFKDLINEKNQLKKQLAELHSKLAGDTRKQVNPVDELTAQYVKAGMKEDAARLIAQGQFDLSNKVVESKVAPIQMESEQAKNREMFSRFAETHKDFESVRPLMEETYNAMSDHDKQWVASHPNGLQYLYDRTKDKTRDEEIQKAVQKGIQEGYKTKTLKTAVAPSTGASTGQPKGNFSDEDISKMSNEEYIKFRKDILASRGVR